MISLILRINLQNMKKYLLSALVIFAFIYYSYSYRRDQTIPLMLPPAASPLPGTDNSSPTTAATSAPVVVSTGTPVTPGATNTPKPINTGKFKNGTYTGNSADAFYGFVQVAAVIENGRLAKVNILSYPNDRSRSIEINQYALPILQSEAIQAQSSGVDIVSGATDTSMAFISSLGSALALAKN